LIKDLCILQKNMTNNTIQNTSVNLDGLLEVLGKNLYSHRHRLEAPNEDEYYIRLICKPKDNQLIIEDNGSGLTHDEIKEFLATIGSGYSRLLRHETGNKDVVGYFGLGFLTAYVIASKVRVVTCSYKVPDTTWKFTSAKGKTYAIAPNEKVRSRGTTVTLELEDTYKNLSNSYFLRSIIQKYCCLLQTPIFINDEKEPVNTLTAPWLRSADISPLIRRKQNLEFAHVFEDQFEPIATFEIPKDNPLNLNGLLWIQGGGSYSTTDNRNLSIFTRNMFITNKEKDLLPRWAGFTGGVIESAKFKPTASRESLQHDDYYQQVCEYLRDLLAANLSRIVTDEAATWRRIISRHSQALLGAAISDDELFETCCHTLVVPTSDGDMTVPDLLKRGDGKIYIKPSSSAGHEEVLFRARGNPLVKGFLYGASGFCHKYSEMHGTALYILGTKDSQSDVFKAITPETENIKTCLLHLFKSSQSDVVFTSFAPAHIPLVVMENYDTIVKNKIESDEADKRISTAVLSLARLTTSQETQTHENTIYINLDNQIIRKLPDLSENNQKNISNMLTGMMEVLCGNIGQSGDSLDNVFSTFNSVVLSLLEGDS